MKPFIQPNSPVILHKKLGDSYDPQSYFYFNAYSDFKYTGLNDDFTHKYSIKFYHLFSTRNNYNILPCYMGYSIVVKKREGVLNLKLANWDLEDVAPDIIISPRGNGLGSIILNHLFYWARENYPNLPAPYIRLSKVDEANLSNKNRRDRLYSKIGLLERENKLIGDLTPTISNYGFQILSIQEFINNLLKEKLELQKSINKVAIEIQILESEIARRKKVLFNIGIEDISYKISNLLLDLIELAIGTSLSFVAWIYRKIKSYIQPTR